MESKKNFMKGLWQQTYKFIESNNCDIMFGVLNNIKTRIESSIDLDDDTKFFNEVNSYPIIRRDNLNINLKDFRLSLVGKYYLATVLGITNASKRKCQLEGLVMEMNDELKSDIDKHYLYVNHGVFAPRRGYSENLKYNFHILSCDNVAIELAVFHRIVSVEEKIRQSVDKLFKKEISRINIYIKKEIEKRFNILDI